MKRKMAPVTPNTTTNSNAHSVAQRAYELWQARGCPPGDDLRDWFEAERQLEKGADAGSAATGRRP